MRDYKHIKTCDQGEIRIIRVIGDASERCQRELEGAIFEMLKTGRNKAVIDLGQIEYLNSIMIGTMVMGLHKIKDTGGVLCLAALTGPTARVIATTNLDKVFPIYDSVDHAVKALGEGP